MVDNEILSKTKSKFQNEDGQSLSHPKSSFLSDNGSFRNINMIFIGV